MTTRKHATPVTARPIQPREIAYYGWRKDTPDQRDLMLAPRGVTRLPSSVDLQTTGFVPPTNDQLRLGSCVGNASAEAFEFALRKLGLTDYRPSRLFTYLEARRIEGTVASDAGCEIRDAMKVLNHLGAPHETIWPYDIGRFAQTPPTQVYQDAAKHLLTKYARVQTNETAVKRALVAGYPVVIGFSVYESFESDQVAQTGIMPIPKASEQMLGGHAVLAIGYTHIKRHPYLICRNSWGTDWGMDGGNFAAPFAWITSTQNAGDFWTCQAVQ